MTAAAFVVLESDVGALVDGKAVVLVHDNATRETDDELSLRLSRCRQARSYQSLMMMLLAETSKPSVLWPAGSPSEALLGSSPAAAA